MIDDPLTQELLDTLGLRQHLQTRYNIAPTEPVTVIRDTRHGRELCLMRWWLLPRWAPQPNTRYAMFNARRETLTHSRAFCEPFKRQRCILPASSFIEWHTDAGSLPASSFIEWHTNAGSKQPYLIRPEHHALAFAGLWERWQHGAEIIDSCTIITTDAVPGFRPIHARMPVMLARSAWEPWLDPGIKGEALASLLEPKLPESLEIFPVDKRIGNSRDKQPPEQIGASRWIAA